jgi:NADH-quinone oxidoreductase E subunit
MKAAAPAGPASVDRVDEIIQKHAGKPGALLPILQDVQAALGWVPEAAMNKIAEALRIPAGKVYSTTSFYTLFSTRPTGKYIIRVCESAPCHVKGAEAVMTELQRQLGIKPGETSTDGRFTLEFTSCIGICGVAPAIMIGDRVHGNLKPDMIAAVLAEYK